MSEHDNIRGLVRKKYGQRAQAGTCGCGQAACCNDKPQLSQALGYTEEQLTSLPQGADLGLGCGNPTALASLQGGEIVLDLGSGAGIDCFLAAQAVGDQGRVIGVDMTPEMIERARENARSHKAENVEFRLGEIENLPVADASVDVVLSNCVINLSPDKPRVFSEAHRILRPGGQMVVSDIVLLRDLPQEIRSSVEAYVGCLAGAWKKEDYLAAIRTAGFRELRVLKEEPADAALPEVAGMSSGNGPLAVSLTLQATKPSLG